MMHEALHPRDIIDKLYVTRKEGRWELVSIEDSVDTSIRWFEDFIKKNTERLIIVAGKNTDTRSNRTKIERKATVWIFQAANKWNLTWENLDMAKKLKFRERSWISSNCSSKQCHKDKLCESKNRWYYKIISIGYVVLETEWLIILVNAAKYAKESKIRHNWVGKVIHWELCKKLKFDN